MNTNACFARLRPLLPVALLGLLTGTATAHPGHAGHEVGGIGWGLAHPLTGFDHLLALIAVGLWAVQLGGRALWLLPVSFIAALGLGAASGMSGLVVPQMEPMLLSSVFALGALVPFAARLPLGISAGIVTAAAFLHGQAHGAEIPAGANGFLAVAGVLAASAALLAGVVAGSRMLQQAAARRVARALGIAMALAAALMGLGVL